MTLTISTETGVACRRASCEASFAPIPNKFYCSDRCRVADCRERHLDIHAAASRRRFELRCVNCDGPFMAGRRDAKVCSPECYAKWRSEAARGAAKVAVEARYRSPLPTRFGRRHPLRSPASFPRMIRRRHQARGIVCGGVYVFDAVDIHGVAAYDCLLCGVGLYVRRAGHDPKGELELVAVSLG